MRLAKRKLTLAYIAIIWFCLRNQILKVVCILELGGLC
jgi:hypothetical protein